MAYLSEGGKIILVLVLTIILVLFIIAYNNPHVAQYVMMIVIIVSSAALSYTSLSIAFHKPAKSTHQSIPNDLHMLQQRIADIERKDFDAITQINEKLQQVPKNTNMTASSVSELVQEAARMKNETAIKLASILSIILNSPFEQTNEYKQLERELRNKLDERDEELKSIAKQIGASTYSMSF